MSAFDRVKARLPISVSRSAGWFASRCKQGIRVVVGEWHYGRWLRFKHFKRAVKQLPWDLTEAAILDAGCGEGTAALWLAEVYPRASVLGIDGDVHQVRQCVAEVRARGLQNTRFEHVEIDALPSSPRFDAIVCIHVLEYITNDEQSLATFFRLLRPGGILLLETVERDLGTDARFGMRAFMPNREPPAGFVRDGYRCDDLNRMLTGVGFEVIGIRYTMAPPALFAHTVFEVLRPNHRRLYLLLLPLLRVVGYSDFLWRWKRGASLMVWARRRPSEGAL